MAESKRTIGLFGGTFDPVHFGHLLMAQDVLEEGGLDEVRFIPAAAAPLRPAPAASAEHRLEMLRLAVGGGGHLRIDERELRRGGVSYTIDTARELRAELPEARLFWILGADQLARLSSWREIGALCREVEFLCVARPGAAAEPPEVPGLRLRRVGSRQIELSATEIRERARSGKSLRYFCPEAVVSYIEANRVYG